MKDIKTLIHYLKHDLPAEDVSLAAVILYLLEHGGRATKDKLSHTLSQYNTSLNFYYEGVLNRIIELDISDTEVFTYEPNSENYFLNISLQDAYLVETAVKLCRQHVQTWQESETQLTTAEGGLPKLVRDKVPAQIQENGRHPVTETIDGDNLYGRLLDKLTEEHIELMQTPIIEEVADMIEVLFAIGRQLGYDEAGVMAAVKEKRDLRGGFNDNTLLKAILSEPESEIV